MFKIYKNFFCYFNVYKYKLLIVNFLYWDIDVWLGVGEFFFLILLRFSGVNVCLISFGFLIRFDFFKFDAFFFLEGILSFLGVGIFVEFVFEFFGLLCLLRVIKFFGGVICVIK